jgi:hypothetical protein
MVLKPSGAFSDTGGAIEPGSEIHQRHFKWFSLAMEHRGIAIDAEVVTIRYVHL